MPQLRNVRTGAVISCSDETATRLGGEWRPEQEKPAPRKRAPKKNDE